MHSPGRSPTGTVLTSRTRLVVRWADEATSYGEYADEALLGRDGAKARWTSCSGRAIKFAKSDNGDKLSLCNRVIALQVPRRLISGGKEECDAKIMYRRKSVIKRQQ